MSKESEQHVIECPSPETLSAYYDGENLPETLCNHIAQCPVCGAKLADYSQIAKIIADLNTETDPDLPERILDSVKTSIKNSSQKKSGLYSPFMIYARVAALIAILGIVGAIIWNDYSAKNRQHIPEPLPIATDRSDAQFAPQSPSDIHLGRIDVNDFSAANFSNVKNGTSEDTAQAGLKTNRAVIPGEVKQTWLIPQNTDFRKNVSIILHIAGIPLSSVKYNTGEDGLVTMEFQATKLQSVKFVRICKKAGYSLLTPDQPQPEQNFFAGNAQDSITYKADFFPKK